MLSNKPIIIMQIVAGFIVCFALTATAGAQFLESTDEFPVPGSRYDGPGPVYYPGAIVEVELVSLSLQGCTPLSPVPTTTASGGLYHIDSFFDVFTELSIDGGEIDSFFDVFVEIDLDIEIPDIAFSTTGTFATEIVSMNLSGNVGEHTIEIRESPTLPSSGSHTITPLAGGGSFGLYSIESFFDVFTELSVDGGLWTAADQKLVMTGMPEPATLGLLLIGALVILRRRK